LARAGHSQAQYRLGRRYDDADPRDPAKAAKWYLKAAKQGLPEAMARLEAMSREGDGVPPGLDEVERWLKRKGEQRKGERRKGERAGAGPPPGGESPVNDDKRFETIEVQYSPQAGPPALEPSKRGDGGLWVVPAGPHRPGPEIKAFIKGAKRGDPVSTYQLGLANLLGDGVPKNLERAVELFRRSAESGVVEAAYGLGVMLLEGVGTEVDEAEGFRWLQKAANAGSPEALFNMYIAYRKDQGLVSAEEGERCLIKAAAAGFPPAMRELEKYRVK
jgi:TPR repeat protein